MDDAASPCFSFQTPLRLRLAPATGREPRRARVHRHWPYERGCCSATLAALRGAKPVGHPKPWIDDKGAGGVTHAGNSGLCAHTLPSCTRRAPPLASELTACGMTAPVRTVTTRRRDGCGVSRASAAQARVRRGHVSLCDNRRAICPRKPMQTHPAVSTRGLRKIVRRTSERTAGELTHSGRGGLF